MHGPAKEQLAIKIDGVLLQAIEKSEDLNQLFNLAEHYGKFHWLNTTSRWACPEVERHVFHKVSSAITTNGKTVTKGAITHVLSEGYDVGGHTPLCVNLAKEQAQRGEHVQLVITRNVTPNVASDIKQSGICRTRGDTVSVCKPCRYSFQLRAVSMLYRTRNLGRKLVINASIPSSQKPIFSWNSMYGSECQ